ncbi:alpha-ketoglutarate decarboxylase [Lutibacter sp.]|uniref:alpha-ketoglutarate decarboxylase n=1 Tax=Lutibacter sp. TaxID=1925666 RepID=UPI0027331EA5|nr:alpha-ketoglutarate decarboxylase [Lutibacter sp.]MDP3313614.1 alpha-ketoglutarate decarboxylase [Lutibacter sp.]
MNKIIILLTFISFTSLIVVGQNSELAPHRFMDDVRFGGGINMSFGTNYTTFSISPSALYDFSNSFAAGFGLKYVYVKTKSGYESTTNIFGGSIIALYKPASNFQISSEFEQLKMDKKFYFPENVSAWQPAWYFGIEYVTGNIAMGLRYDVLFDKQENLLYSSALSPVFRVYF